MDSGSTQADDVAAKTSAGPSPFDQVMVSIRKSELIQLKADRNSYKSLCERQQQKIAKLLKAIERLAAWVRDLQHRKFKGGPDKTTTKQEKQQTPSAQAPARRPRGQQRKSKGHGRAPRPKLPFIEETVEPEPSEIEKASAGSEKPLESGPDRVTWILEFRLVAFLRKVVRKTYRAPPCKPESAPASQGQAAPGIECTKTQDEVPRLKGTRAETPMVAADAPIAQEAAAAASEAAAVPQAGAAAAQAPPVKRKGPLIAAKAPARLIPRSLLGVSVWVEILLWKFHHMIPMNRLLQMLRYLGVVLAAGMIDGGLKRLARLFEPLLEAFKLRQLSEDLFNADETYWKVLEKIAGKVGYRWYLWTFISPSVCFYILDPSRSAKVPLSHFEGLLHKAMLVVDRYSAYKRLPKTLSILLAFCWAHVRRDHLELSRNYPKLEGWALGWVDRISTLYHLNKQRLKVGAAGFAECDRKLREHVKSMADQWAKELADPKLHTAARKRLESMARHWEGLCRFVDHLEISMDNNKAERMLRPQVTGRKAFYGSGSVWSAHLAASLFTVFMTLVHCWKINPRHWLTEYLNACAENGGNPPQDLSRFLPWQMTPERLAKLRGPLPPEPLNLILDLEDQDADKGAEVHRPERDTAPTPGSETAARRTHPMSVKNSRPATNTS